MTQTQNEPFNPAELEEDEFLAGPDRYEAFDEGELLDVDPIFEKPFARIHAEQKDYDPASVEVRPDAVRTPALAAAGYVFVEIKAGVLLLDQDGAAVGGVIGCDVAVDEAHQGQGLGAELILDYAMRNGSLPTWDLDEAAYSPAGEAACRAAWRLARDPKVFAAKRQALLDAETRNG